MAARRSLAEQGIRARIPDPLFTAYDLRQDSSRETIGAEVAHMTIYGWDCSHFDAPDTRGAASAGIEFMTHKAGGDRDDAEVGSWWAMMRPYRDQLLLGAYWVQYPGNPTGRADAFISRLDATCPGWRDGPFILQVDCEIWGGDRGTLPGRADIRAFCDRLRQRAPRLMPIVYGPKWCYGDTLAGLGYPLWASAYVSASADTPQRMYPGDLSSRWAAYSGQTPTVLQFTSSAKIGGQSTCDANAYRGTIEQLTALLAPGWVEDDMSLEWDDKPWKAPDPISVADALQRTYNNVNKLAAAQEAARVAEVQRDATESAAIAGLVSVVQTLATLGGAITPDQFNDIIDQVKAAAGDAAANAVGPLEQEIQSLRQHLGDDAPAAKFATGGLVAPDDPDIYTRTMREQAQHRIAPPQAG